MFNCIYENAHKSLYVKDEYATSTTMVEGFSIQWLLNFLPSFWSHQVCVISIYPFSFVTLFSYVLLCSSSVLSLNVYTIYFVS
jgi:hypothetical protein